MNRASEHKREDILSLVQAAWVGLPHARAAETWHNQIGPNVPLVGNVRHDEVFHDLRRAMKGVALDEGRLLHDEFVDVKLRDDAVAHVRKGRDEERWAERSQCDQLIDERADIQEAIDEQKSRRWLRRAAPGSRGRRC